MNRRDFTTTSLLGLGDVLLQRKLSWAQTSATNDGDLGNEEYYDSTVPRDPANIPLGDYTGERYEALVPDTLDLAQEAGKIVNFLTRAVSPRRTDYAVYHLMHLGYNPAILEVCDGGLQNQNAKWAEAVIPLRVMSGSTLNKGGERAVVGALVRITGKDGLCYVPVKNRPWAIFDPVTEKLGQPYADMFGEGRQLRAYATWYQHDKDPFWRKLAERKINRLREISIQKGDTCYFKMARGYSPWYKETGKGAVVALGDVGEVYNAMEGGAAANIVCWAPQAAATWYKLTGYEPALELARGLAQYLYRDKVFYDDRTQSFSLMSSAFWTHCMNSLLSYALIAGDREMIKWVKVGFEQFVEINDPGHTGIMPWGTYGCTGADMTQVALMLSCNGYGNYWEQIDRWTRNGFFNRLIEQEDVEKNHALPFWRGGDPHNPLAFKSGAFYMRGKPPIPLNQPLPGELHQPDDAIERCMGSFHAPGCCNGNMARAVYLIWDSILEKSGRDLRVNLLLNRASPWADLDSYLPFEGKAVIRIRQGKHRLVVRIPEWTDWDKVRCSVAGKERRFAWLSDGYIDLGDVMAKDEVTVSFPLREWVVKNRIVAPSGLVDFTATFKANTVTEVDNEKVTFPIARHTKYRASNVSQFRLQRLASQEKFIWW
jgi:hypothetical protein